MSKSSNTIVDVPGIKVGHAQKLEAMTGCTVILCEKGAVGGVDQRGGAPGTRETDLLRPLHLVNEVHAVVLAGGSAFGLDAASGVMRYLAERQIGFNTGVSRVPIVPAAVIFDLALGQSNIFPDAEMGYSACVNASNTTPEQGNIGCGTGAAVGKIFGMDGAMKSGLGSASCQVGGGIYVGALVAVNAFGDVVDPADQTILAGARPVHHGVIHLGGEGKFADTLKQMRSFEGRSILKFASLQNTVIGVVATNAKLNKEEANKVAQMAQNGLARTIRPAHTMFDGDTIFSLSTGGKSADVNTIGAYACEVVAEAIVNAVTHAKSAGGLPSANDLRQSSI